LTRARASACARRVAQEVLHHRRAVVALFERLVFVGGVAERAFQLEQKRGRAQLVDSQIQRFSGEQAQRLRGRRFVIAVVEQTLRIAERRRFRGVEGPFRYRLRRREKTCRDCQTDDGRGGNAGTGSRHGALDILPRSRRGREHDRRAPDDLVA
jgi:hypothetical protein